MHDELFEIFLQQTELLKSIINIDVIDINGLTGSTNYLIINK